MANKTPRDNCGSHVRATGAVAETAAEGPQAVGLLRIDLIPKFETGICKANLRRDVSLQPWIVAVSHGR